MNRQEKIKRLREVIGAIDPQVFNDLLQVANKTDKQNNRKEKFKKLGWLKGSAKN